MPTRTCARARSMEAIDIIQRIWSQDPPYDIAGEFWNVRLKDAIIPELGIGFMPKPFQRPGPPISISLASPQFPHRAHRRAARLGDHLCQHHPRLLGRHRIGRSTARRVPKRASRRAARIGAWRATSWWRAERRGGARARLRRTTDPTAISIPICARCWARVGLLVGTEASRGHAGRARRRSKPSPKDA